MDEQTLLAHTYVTYRVDGAVDHSSSNAASTLFGTRFGQLEGEVINESNPAWLIPLAPPS